jgi:hypothetical protein
MTAAVAPWTARAAMSAPSVGARAQATDASRKPAMPQLMARFAPIRSDRLPAKSSSDANSSVYASMTHCSPEVLPSNSRPIVVRATLTIRMSRVMRKNPRAASRSVRRAALRVGGAVGSVVVGAATV